MVPAFVAFDCETSGLDPVTDGILQLAAVRVESGQVQSEFVRLIRPERPVPLGILRLTGLDPGALAAAEPAEAVLAAFLEFVGNLPLVAHNAPFDQAFLRRALERARLPRAPEPVFDTHELARILAPALPSYRLATLANHWGLPTFRAHDALEDARATAAVFLQLLGGLGQLDEGLLRTLERLLRPTLSPTWQLVQGALHQRLWISTPDLPSSVGGAEVPANGRETPGPERRTPVPFDPDRLAALLGRGGPLEALLGAEAFEERPGQQQMLRAVAAALASGRHLLVEAGTGTGKTLAYLVPALAWAAAKGERVVVSTHTVSLQEQLLEKDLPLLRQAGFDGPVALLKGRGHYLCLKLWEEALAEEVDAERGPFLARVAAWLAQTTTGDRAELGLYGEDEAMWAALSAESVACTASRCPHYARCFLFRARREAEEADLVVVNHALLLSDLRARNQVLPSYDYLICDEAHHLEEVAAQHLGVSLGEGQLERFFWALARGTGSRAAGFLPSLSRESSGRLGAAVEAASAALAVAWEASHAWFHTMRAWADQEAHGPEGHIELRLDRRRRSESWPPAAEAGSRLQEGLRQLAACLEGIAAEMPEGDPRAAEAHALGVRAEELAEAVQVFLEGRDGWVTWADVRLRNGVPAGVALYAAPIEPGALLAERLFHRQSVILTSATLAVANSFAFTAERLGLAGMQRVDNLAVPSPFSYQQQALFCLPENIPDLRQLGPERFASSVSPFLAELARCTKGRMLVLFTANRLLRAVYRELKPVLEPEGIEVLGQGLDGSRSRLTQALLAGEPAVVLGAASFWEGVDVPGEALSCVVIAQLPFRAPDIPLLAAQCEALARSGRDPFADLSLPQAVLRFKQGFGRLIRSARDRGLAVCLDPRLLRASYGRTFLASLPGPRLFVGSTDQVLEQARIWLGMG